jgi:hypothetical protein
MSAREVQEGFKRDIEALEEVFEDDAWTEQFQPADSGVHYPAMEKIHAMLESHSPEIFSSYVANGLDIISATRETRHNDMETMYWIGYLMGLKGHMLQKCDGSHHQNNPHAN